MYPPNTKMGEPQSRSGLLKNKISCAFQKYLEIIIVYHSVNVFVFAKLRKTTNSFVMSVCLSVPLFVSLFVRVEQLSFHRTDFHEI